MGQTACLGAATESVYHGATNASSVRLPIVQ